jgi:nitrogen fixation/metabolism regulation signal transduction histidine kinase
LGELYPELRLPPLSERAAWFDPIQLEQVMINLMKNACEAGSAVSDIELRVVVTETGESEVELLDRGRGFSEEGLKNALVPLYSTKQQGGGMGLALCREIVEAHGGSIGVSNRQGGGAWIRLVLPGRTRPENPSLARSRLTLTRT